jgi:hypothetical protein
MYRICIYIQNYCFKSVYTACTLTVRKKNNVTTLQIVVIIFTINCLHT